MVGHCPRSSGSQYEQCVTFFVPVLVCAFCSFFPTIQMVLSDLSISTEIILHQMTEANNAQSCDALQPRFTKSQ